MLHNSPTRLAALGVLTYSEEPVADNGKLDGTLGLLGLQRSAKQMFENTPCWGLADIIFSNMFSMLGIFAFEGRFSE